MPLFSTTASGIASALLQQDYLPGLQAQINNDTVLSDRLARVPKHMFVGNQIQMAAHTARGITHVVDHGVGDILPPRSVQGYAQLTFDVVEIAQRIGLSASSLMRTRNAPDGAFVEFLGDQMEGAKNDISQDLNRQRFGDATGRLAKFVVNVNSTVQEVDSTKYLRESAVIVCADTLGTDVDANADNTIVSINSGTEITLSAAITTVSETGGGDYIYNRRGASAPIRLEDMWGLQSIVDTTNPWAGNFGGLTRSTNRTWQGNRLTAASDRPLHSRLMMHGLNLAQRRAGKKNFKNYLGITTDAAWLEYGEDIVADKRYPAGYITMEGGWAALEFAGVPITWDKDCPQGKLFFIAEDDLMIAEAEAVQFEDRDGAVLFRGTAGAHQFEAWLYTYQNLVARRCNSSVAIENIKESNRTDNL